MSETTYWWLMGLTFTTSAWPWMRVLGMVIIAVCMVVSLVRAPTPWRRPDM